ncbi:MAG: glyoxalase [Rhodobacteraceae bacterium]|nr:MAG: glyoxalase [Paracoccaceae bacterium]|tara:strand:- start:33 stop:443 length:411 start_codon:yes stop_codon:yes gene_type:complete
MKIKLHHINLATQNVSRMKHFYKHILFLDDVVDDLPTLEKSKGYSGSVGFVGDGNIQTHIAEKDLEVNFKTGHYINPVEKGHIAYRTDNLEKFKKHLKDKNIEYSDWEETAVSGWKQIFFYDPDGNIIEVHEKVKN